MKKVKKTFAALLTAAMICTLLFVPVTAGGPYYLNEGFDDAVNYPIEGTHDGTISLDGTNRASYVATKGSGDLWSSAIIEDGAKKYLKYETIKSYSNEASVPYLKLGLTEPVDMGYAVLEFKVSLPELYNAAANNPLLSLELRNDAGGLMSAISFRINDATTGGIKVTSTGAAVQNSASVTLTKVADYELGTWATVKFIINLDEKCYSIFINDQFLGDNAFVAAVNTTPLPVNLAEVRVATNKGNNIGEVYLDDFMVYPVTDEDAQTAFNASAMVEDFEWGTNYTSPTYARSGANEGKENTLLIGGKIGAADANYYHSHNYSAQPTPHLTMSLVEDAENYPEYGQYLNYDLHIQAGGLRGVLPNDGMARMTGGYVVSEFEFKKKNAVDSLSIWISNADTGSGPFQMAFGETYFSNSYWRHDSGTSGASSEASYKNYLKAEDLTSTGQLLPERWYKVTLLSNLRKATLDVFIDGVLIATDAAKRGSSTNYADLLINDRVTGIMIGSQKTGSVINFDNIKVYSATEKHAANLVAAGLDKLIDNGVVGDRLVSNRLYLPLAQTLGNDPHMNNYYAIYTSDDELLLENKEGKGITYSLSGEKASDFTLIDSHARFILNSTVDTENFTIDKLFADGVGGAWPNIQNRTVGNTYLGITAGRPKGYEPNVPVTLSAVIKKGGTVINKSYDLVFNRPLATSNVIHLEVGEPVVFTDSGTVSRKTYIENKGSLPETVVAVIAMYDDEGTLYDAVFKSVPIGAGEGELSDISVTLTPEDEDEIYNIQHYLWVGGTLIPILQ